MARVAAGTSVVGGGTVGTEVGLSSEHFDPARLNGLHGVEMTRQHSRAELGAIRGPMKTEDVGDVYHDGKPLMTALMALEAA